MSPPKQIHIKKFVKTLLQKALVGDNNALPNLKDHFELKPPLYK